MRFSLHTGVMGVDPPKGFSHLATIRSLPIGNMLFHKELYSPGITYQNTSPAVHLASVEQFKREYDKHMLNFLQH